VTQQTAAKLSRYVVLAVLDLSCSPPKKNCSRIFWANVREIKKKKLFWQQFFV
jgi:hypothetical protein